MNLNDQVTNDCGLCAAVVYEAISRHQNRNMRVVELRKELKTDYGESVIKRAIRDLMFAGYIEREGETYDCRGFKYRIVK